MASVLYGQPVAKALTDQVKNRADALRRKDLVPTLAIIRLGENSADLAYERGARKKGDLTGVRVLVFSFSREISQESLEQELIQINDRKDIHGILLFQPLPSHLLGESLRECISFKKDVDGITLGSGGGIYENRPIGHCPCTAEAVVALLEYYSVPLEGKKVVVLGRSLVIGKPVSLMLLHKNATVTVCHSKTKNIQEMTRQADVLVTAIGQGQWLDASYLQPGQTIVDVGINFTSEGTMVGDVNEESIRGLEVNYTPVPKGVGSITSSLLMKHVVDSLWSTLEKE